MTRPDPAVEGPASSAPFPLLVDEIDEHMATRQHAKLTLAELGPDAEVPNQGQRAASSRGALVLGVVLLGAVFVGAIGAVVVAGAGRTLPATSAPVVVSVPHTAATPTIQAPSAPPTPSPTPPPAPQPIVTTPPAPQPIVTTSPAPTTPVVTANGPCPLGMASLSAGHRVCVDLYEYPGGHTIPRTQVSFADAAQICKGRGLRLCSDNEWEQACRGPSQASYPYGTSYDPQRCNTGGKATPGVVQPAGAMARCRSAVGAYDMSGNVAEWTASGTQRGGSAMQAPPHGRCSHAVRGADVAGAADVGFRCCGDAH